MGMCEHYPFVSHFMGKKYVYIVYILYVSGYNSPKIMGAGEFRSVIFSRGWAFFENFEGISFRVATSPRGDLIVFVYNINN